MLDRIIKSFTWHRLSRLGTLLKMPPNAAIDSSLWSVSFPFKPHVPRMFTSNIAFHWIALDRCDRLESICNVFMQPNWKKHARKMKQRRACYSIRDKSMENCIFVCMLSHVYLGFIYGVFCNSSNNKKHIDQTMGKWPAKYQVTGKNGRRESLSSWLNFLGLAAITRSIWPFNAFNLRP